MACPMRHPCAAVRPHRNRRRARDGVASARVRQMSLGWGIMAERHNGASRAAHRNQKGVTMPAILTHDFFARDVAECAKAELPLATLDERDAFLLGSQGPDPLFYIELYPLMAKWAEMGGLMHDKRPARLLAAMREAVDRLSKRERAVGAAYLAGFSCHWLLDSTVHPFINAWAYDLTHAGVAGLGPECDSKVHMEVERDLDEAVLFRKTGKTIAEYRPFANTLRASREALAIIDKLYFYAALWTYGRPIDPTTFSASVGCYRTMMRLLYATREHHRSAIAALERAISGAPYSTYSALSHRVRASASSEFDNSEHRAWTNPATGIVSRESFANLYERALDRATSVVASVLSPGFDSAASYALTGNINFGGTRDEESFPLSHGTEAAAS